MKILVGFDDVLLNTKKFKDNYRKLFKKHGVSKSIFLKHYYDEKNAEREIRSYDPKSHLDGINKKEKIDISKLKVEVMDFPKMSHHFMHRDFVKFVGSFRKKDIIVITFTNTEFQKNKVKYCGVLKYVGKCIFTGKLKSEAVGKIYSTIKNASRENLYFIDDRAEQIKNVKKKYPEINTILLRRKNGTYHDKETKYCDYVAKNLIEAKKIILNTKH